MITYKLTRQIDIMAWRVGKYLGDIKFLWHFWL